MSKTNQFKCSCCGNVHDEWPALAFVSPDNYNFLSEQEKKDTGYLDSDFCTINDNGTIHRFIRCVLIQEVNDHCQDLDYGLWVSLSEKSYADYKEHFKEDREETVYFGWLCNDIVGYEFSESVPMNVATRNNGQRPELFPHNTFDHPFVKDYYDGISKEEAEKRIAKALEIVKTNQDKQKKWWKIGK